MATVPPRMLLYHLDFDLVALLQFFFRRFDSCFLATFMSELLVSRFHDYRKLRRIHWENFVRSANFFESCATRTVSNLLGSYCKQSPSTKSLWTWGRGGLSAEPRGGGSLGAKLANARKYVFRQVQDKDPAPMRCR